MVPHPSRPDPFEPYCAMIRTPVRLFGTLIVPVIAPLIGGTAMLALAVPLAAQQQGDFTLPKSTPTPTPAPAGPADERAGVSIPPRSLPVPRIEAAPVLTPDVAPRPAATSSPQTSDRGRTPTPTPTAAAKPDAATRPGPAAPAPPTPAPAIVPSDSPTLPTPLTTPGPLAGPSASPSAAPQMAPPVVSDQPALRTLPDLPPWWPWAAGVLGALAVLGAGLMLLRRRAPKVLRLAAPPPGAERNAPPAAPSGSSADAAPNPLGVTLEITAATRSVMMFTLHYRIALANRSAQAVNGVNLAVALACARNGADNAPSPGAAQRLEQIARIGPHQTHTITGEVQLPLSQIAPLRQGSLLLFIPLAHVTIEGDSQHASTRSFVIGTPSAASTGRLHPIRLDLPPGSIPGLLAQRIDVPAISAAA